MVNHEEIWADDYAAAPGANTLELMTGSMTNHGTLGATSGGTLDVIGSYAINQGATGAVVATDGGTVQLQNNIFVTGSLQTKGTGVIVTTASSFAATSVSLTHSFAILVNKGPALILPAAASQNLTAGEILLAPATQFSLEWLERPCSPRENPRSVIRA